MNPPGNKMKAAVRSKYGLNNLRIEEVDKPLPKSNEILVKVKASTVNRTDCANLTAKPFIMRLVFGLFNPKNKFIGTDFAGEIVAKGKSVGKFEVGDKVFGFNDMVCNAHAEYLTMKEDGFIDHMPSNQTFAVAAAGLEGAHYAYTFIHKVNLKPGEKILINGATGAIGSALLQLSRQFDVLITATCKTENAALIKSLGADEIIDYTKEDFTQSGKLFDYVFDAVGKSSFGRCKSILKKGGVYISSELGPYNENPLLALTTKIVGKRKVIFPIPYPIPTTIPYLKEKIENHTLQPVIDRVYPFSAIKDAYDYVMKGQKLGNVLLSFSDE